jgi:hypothetical protein
MNKKIILAMGILIPTLADAQYVTYSHDDAKMNQITVAEIGSGSLTPSLYYDLLHKSYAKTAATKNKLSFRTAAAVALYKQVDDAEALDSALTKRAEIEALNVADRTGGALDVAWVAEGGKINSKLADYQQNIRRIMLVGGTANEQAYWQEYYNVFVSALKATQSAYMPNSQRKKQYLQIYADITNKNDMLIYYLVRLANAKSTSKLLTATYNKPDNKAEIVLAAMNRWREAGWKTAPTKGSNSTGIGNGLIISPGFNRDPILIDSIALRPGFIIRDSLFIGNTIIR